MGLIDCCLRSPAMTAEQMLAAADMLTYAVNAVLGCEGTLAGS
jgi:hypothetical protein